MGTAIFSKIAADKSCSILTANDEESGAVSLPYPGEQECGDDWSLDDQSSRRVILVADGLGHGPFAASAASAAISAFQDSGRHAIDRIMDSVKGAMASTRGGCVAISEVDYANSQIHFCGIGNVSGVIVKSSSQRSMVSLNGTVGRGNVKSRVFDYPWEDGDLLVMHTDGAQTQWNLLRSPGLQLRHPELIAGILYRDYTRGRDDVTIVVSRLTSKRSEAP